MIRRLFKQVWLYAARIGLYTASCPRRLFNRIGWHGVFFYSGLFAVFGGVWLQAVYPVKHPATTWGVALFFAGATAVIRTLIDVVEGEIALIESEKKSEE